MRIPRRIGLFALVLAPGLGWACSTFEDPTPENISFRIEGPAGTTVEAIYSTQFVAGVDEQNVTRVQVFRSDTVLHLLPIDTVFDISIDRRFFVQVTPEGSDPTAVAVRVDVDDRTVLSDTGDLVAAEPWRYVYMFNQQLTRVVDVVF
jgi:hypothetical protein